MAFRIGFLGTPEFAAICLRRLLETGATLAGVITAPDRPKGRSLESQPTPVRVLAERAGLPVITPADVNDPAVVETLRSWHLNVLVVVAFGQILKDSFLQLPPLGCVNVHPSMLPEYRGAAPMQRALMDGQKETGVTVCRMVRKLDAGDILAQQTEMIHPEDTFGILHDRLAAVGADLLVETLKALASGTQKSVPQDDTRATHAPKLQRQEEFIRWDKPATQIHNLVRALNPMPGASSVLLRRGAKGVKEQVKIWSVRADGVWVKGIPGEILEVGSGGMRVATAKGSIAIREIQSASKAKMPVAQWVLGHRVAAGDRFE